MNIVGGVSRGVLFVGSEAACGESLSVAWRVRARDDDAGRVRVELEEALARLARSTYFHQLRAMARPDRDEGLLALVRDAFENSGRRYGYRRAWLDLRDAGVVVSARRVMRLMTRHGLVPPLKRARRYSSYRGEIGGEAPVIHSDRGCHYRWPEWIRICEEHGLTRSMSAKGCSPDNAAAERFFGRLKQEFLHCRDFAGIGMDEFIRRLDGYMTWYRDERIKLEYGTSIRARRRQLGLMA